MKPAWLSFSFLIGTLAILDTLLFAMHFLTLSRLESSQRETSQQVEFGIWIDFFGWMFFVAIACYLYFGRDNFGENFCASFHLAGQTWIRYSTFFFCYVLPLVLLTGLMAAALQKLSA